jgi:hypothetical protein
MVIKNGDYPDIATCQGTRMTRIKRIFYKNLCLSVLSMSSVFQSLIHTNSQLKNRFKNLNLFSNFQTGRCLIYCISLWAF